MDRKFSCGEGRGGRGRKSRRREDTCHYCMRRGGSAENSLVGRGEVATKQLNLVASPLGSRFPRVLHRVTPMGVDT